MANLSKEYTPLNMLSNRDDVLDAATKTEELLEAALALWSNPGCANSHIGDLRNEVVTAIREALDVNDHVIHTYHIL